MRSLKKVIILLILLFPLSPYFYKISGSSLRFDLINEKTKIEKNYNLKGMFSVLEFLNQLQGTILAMQQGEILHYTNLDLIYIYDKRFFDIFSSNKDLQKVNYIALNHYNDPVMYSPLLESILYKPNKSQLIFDYFGWKIFKLGAYNLPFVYSETDFRISLAERGRGYHTYISHKNEHPSLDIMPKAEDGDFPSLATGLYDFICEMTVEVDQNTKIDLKVYPDFNNCGAQVFCLKKGKNRLLTRFLRSNEPFRLVAFSKNPNITFHSVKLSYGFKKTLISHQNSLNFTKTGITFPKKDRKAVFEVNKHEILTFKKPFPKRQSLTFKVGGYGTLIVAVSIYSKQLSKLLRWRLSR